MSSKLYVGTMSFKTSEDELRSAFGQFGNVTDVYVAMDKMTGRPRGFAFVTFSSPEEAKVAAEKLNGADLEDPTSWAAAKAAMAKDFTPLSDMRASAAYRSEVAANLLVRALLEISGAPAPTRLGDLRAAE